MLSCIELMDTHLSLDLPAQTAFLVPRIVALGAYPPTEPRTTSISPRCSSAKYRVKE
jgi:hypothetical protein